MTEVQARSTVKAFHCIRAIAGHNQCSSHTDNAQCKDRKEGQRVKHIDVIHHFARDHVASGELSFVSCKSEENVSDCLTKALSRPLFEKGLEGLGMVST
jgi:hypothetical protein